MASEIRVNTINNSSGLGTITISDTGAVFTGVTTIASLEVTGSLVGVANTAIINTQSVNVSGVVTATSFSGDGSALTGLSSDAISEGNTSAEVVDTGSDGHFKVITEGTEALRVTAAQRFGVGTASPNTRFVVSNSGAEGVEFDPGYTSGASSILAYNRSGSAYTDLKFEAAQYALNIGASEKARLDSSGRLLVGTTTSRSRQLFVKGGAIANSIADTTSTNTVIAKFDAINYPSNDTGRFAAIDFATDASTWYFGEIRFITNGADGTATAGTERMRISSNGEVMIGHSSAVTGTQFLSIRVASGQNGASFEGDSDAGRSMITFRNTNGEVGYISTSGSTTGYSTSSDYRLKENIVAVSDGIGRLKQLQPSRFNFIADPDKTVDGFIAHEVQDVVPEAIFGEKDAVDDEGNPKYQGIDQSKLVPLLTAALQEAIAKIETLETEKADILARLDAAGI